MTMERNIQIIVAVLTGTVGIIFGVLLILSAVRYRRRLIGANKGFVVRYRKQNRRRGAEDDRISMRFGQRYSQNYDNISFASNYSRTSRPASLESLSEVQLRPKLNQERWKRMSSRNDRKSFKSEIFREQTEKDIYEDVSTRRKSSRRKQSPSLNSKPNDCAGQELVTIVRRHSEILEMRHIPRPIVRPYKSELYKDAENVYDLINPNEN